VAAAASLRGAGVLAWAAAHSKLPANANNTVRVAALDIEIMLTPGSMAESLAIQYDGIRKQKDKKN
jgi:hypothetical protein